MENKIFIHSNASSATFYTKISDENQHRLHTHTHTQHTPIVLSSMVLSCYSVHAVEVIRADLDRAFLGSRLARQL